MKNIINALISVFFVFALALAPAWAESGEVTAVVFTWENMGLMGPGDESAHYVSVARASETVQHSIDYHHGPMIQKIILYRAEDGARYSLLDALEKAAKGWVSSYRENILDGSSWRVVIHYTDGSMKEFEGYGKIPPGAEEIKKQVRELAEYEIRPKLF